MLYIIKTDGTRLYLQGEKARHTALREARYQAEHQTTDTVQLSILADRPIDWQIGDRLTLWGKRYTLNRLPTMRRDEGLGIIEYTATLEARHYDLARVYYDTNATQTSERSVQGNTSVGNLRHFMELLIANAERVFPNTFTLGEVIETETKTLTFEADTANALSVLQRLCREFKAEWQLIEDETGERCRIDLRAEGWGERHPHVFALGRQGGLYVLERTHLDSRNITTRLRAYGSSENLGRGYRAERLCLPEREPSRSTIEDEAKVRRYGVWEAVKHFDDIKPTRTGVVTSGANVPRQTGLLRMQDNEMFDLKARDTAGNSLYLIAGTPAKVNFISGQLQGYTLDVVDYTHSTNTFTLKRPEGLPHAFVPKAGDKYKLIDIGLPPNWVREAEQRLYEEARAWYEQNSTPRASYRLELAKDWLFAQYGQGAMARIFDVGGYLHVQDAEAGIDRYVRITNIQRNLLDGTSISLQLADKVQVSYIQRIIEEQVEREQHIQDVERKASELTNRRFREAQETAEALVASLGDRFGGAINPVAVSTMQLLAGDDTLQFVFVNSPDDRTARPLSLRYDKETKGVQTQGTHYLMHYTLPDKTLGSAIHTQRLRVWTLPPYDSPILAESDKPYYLYALCSPISGDENARFTLSSERLQGVEGDSYRLLVGMLSSEDPEGERSFVSLHGFSEILPGRVTTDRIVSASGHSYFDLQTGHINGLITITNSDGKPIIGRTHKDGRTTIDGGLVLSERIGAVDARGKLRTELCGAVDACPVAFRAGISDDGTEANVEIRHSGDARFGQARIDAETGQYSFVDPTLGRSYLHIGGALMPLESLMQNAAFSERIELAERQAISLFGVNGTNKSREFAINGTATDIYCTLSVRGESLSEADMNGGSNNWAEDDPSRPRYSDAKPSGRIVVKLIDQTGRVLAEQHSHVHSTGGVDRLILSVKGVQVVERFRLSAEIESREALNPYGSDGMISADIWGELRYSGGDRSTMDISLTGAGANVFYGTDRFLSLRREGEPFMTVRGVVDMYGVLVSGRVQSSGVSLWQTGAKRSLRTQPVRKAGRDNEVVYTVYHEIGHTRYCPQVMAIRGRDLPVLRRIERDYFEVAFVWTPQEHNRYSYSAEFVYACMGEP